MLQLISFSAFYFKYPSLYAIKVKKFFFGKSTSFETKTFFVKILKCINETTQNVGWETAQSKDYSYANRWKIKIFEL